MKNILVLAHDDAGQEARLQAALDITRALDGHLTCLDVCALPALATEPWGADGAAILLQYETDREAGNRARIERHFTNEDVAWDLQAITGDFASALEDQSRMADLIVVNRQLDTVKYGDLESLAARLIVHSGKPVVAVPEECRSFGAGGTAIVAWNGSGGSIAALQAAIPLLKLAKSVIILQVDDGTVQTPAREAATYLSHHDVHALIRFEKATHRTVSEAILSEVRDRRGDYLVLGGFGRNRLLEGVFGGVTRDMLCRSPVPLFLAHG